MSIQKKKEKRKKKECFRWLLHKICENTGFYFPVFFCISTESTILVIYKRVRVSEKSHSDFVLCSRCLVTYLNPINKNAVNN